MHEVIICTDCLTALVNLTNKVYYVHMVYHIMVRKAQRSRSLPCNLFLALQQTHHEYQYCFGADCRGRLLCQIPTGCRLTTVLLGYVM